MDARTAFKDALTKDALDFPGKLEEVDYLDVWFYYPSWDEVLQYTAPRDMIVVRAHYAQGFFKLVIRAPYGMGMVATLIKAKIREVAVVEKSCYVHEKVDEVPSFALFANKYKAQGYEKVTQIWGTQEKVTKIRDDDTHEDDYVLIDDFVF
ncbi:uncharacterized protein LOC112349131 [Selaginella moellendorffii]|uniref:uncharacterized protein LOC112349131 n=1 Tax=Selaginella moellendorffii TaxID=88036 RepID=UPI000D1CA9BA|nr:uncharacterized protein LOC112349131 [Selaginella moellendorffii]|eukprot:XP_024538696.1 uncharacterized protein LOC112349131 [Selaginella moellendorffii]